MAGLDHRDRVGIAAGALVLLSVLVLALSLTLLIARIKSATRALFDESGLSETVGPDRFSPTVRAAVAACADHQLLEPV